MEANRPVPTPGGCRLFGIAAEVDQAYPCGMYWFGNNNRLLPMLAVCALLIGAHVGAALHTIEHDLGGLQGKACSICVTAAQLGSTSVDSCEPLDFDAPGTVFFHTVLAEFQTTHAVAVRQRGPPASLTV